GDRLQGGLRVGLAGARGSRDPRGNRELAGPSSEGGDNGTDPEHERREAADVTLRPPDEPGQTFIRTVAESSIEVHDDRYESESIGRDRRRRKFLVPSSYLRGHPQGRDGQEQLFR